MELHIHQFGDDPPVRLDEEVEELPAGVALNAGVAEDGDALVQGAGFLRVPERGHEAGRARGRVRVAAAERQPVGLVGPTAPMVAVAKSAGEAEALVGSAAARMFRFALR